MLVTLKDHEILRSNLRVPSDAQFYAILLAADGAEMQEFRSWGNSSQSLKYRNYWQLLTEGPAYQLYPREPALRRHCDTSLAVPAALLNVVDVDDHGTRLRLTQPLFHDENPELSNALTVGQEFWGAPTDPDYGNEGWRVLSGLQDTYAVPVDCCQPWTPDWENPFSLEVGKVIREYGGVIPQSAIGYHVSLLRERGSSFVRLQQGNQTDVRLPEGHFLFPETDKDRDIFARKVHVPFRVLVSPDVQGMLHNQSGLGRVVNHSTNVNWEFQGLFHLGTAAPDYLAVDPADYKRVTFVPHGRVAAMLEQSKDPWTDASRQSTTWGKLVRLLLNPEHCQSEPHVEAFASKMVALATDRFGPEDGKPELLVVRGADIAKAYNQGSVTGVGGGSTGAKSCMNAKPDSFFAVYAENPDQVGLLICRDRDTGLLHGRALLWTDAQGQTFLDRRYVLNPVAEQRMVAYATGLGYRDIWTGLSSAQFIRVDILLANPYHLHYPWIDSLAYFNPQDGTLRNQYESGMVKLQYTSGHRDHKAYESLCAQSQVAAPKDKMEKTASGDYAFAQYVKTLRSGQKELEARCCEDQLEGGLISKAEQLTVATKDGGRITSKGNPSIALASTLEQPRVAHYTKDLLVMSPLDGGFIYKAQALQQPDGGWCLPQTVAKYRAVLSRRKVNQALRPSQLAELAQATAPVEDTFINAATELAVAA